MNITEITDLLSDLVLEKELKSMDSATSTAIRLVLQTDKDWDLSLKCAEEWHKEDIDETQAALTLAKSKKGPACRMSQLPPDNNLNGVEPATAALIRVELQVEDDWQQALDLAGEWHTKDLTSQAESSATDTASRSSSGRSTPKGRQRVSACTDACNTLKKDRKTTTLIADSSTKWQCGICFEAFIAHPDGKNSSTIKLFGRPLGCDHAFCNDCLGKAIWEKVREKDRCFPIRCPEPKCNHEIDDDTAERALRYENFKEWCNKKALHAIRYKIYCPIQRCSKVVELDEEMPANQTEAECPYCHTLICIQCRVPYHVGFSCRDYQKIPISERTPEDLQTLQLVNKKLWSRCPDCKIFVERTAGCPHMLCRCGCHL
ncbi:hypothetical protein BDF19DRAFT_425239 [Syncephalis fuscata]|nr:hypothetical protein BDF19DRAFT_425239 [Syncephalis fuscata]